MAKAAKQTKRGRPPEFDENEVLDAAMRVFWENGYEGATLSKLTDAMRITRSSMFAAFGNKEALFKRAYIHYVDRHQGYLKDALEKPTAREMIESALRGTVDFLSNPGHPKGCLSHGVLAVGDEADSVKRWLMQIRKEGAALARERFERAKESGGLAKDVDPAALARYVATLINGLCVQGASGATKAEMNKVVDAALHFMAC
jgi:AcrR family transcriptional regulator